MVTAIIRKPIVRRVGLLVALLAVLATTTISPANVMAGPLDKPGISNPYCDENSNISLYWHTENRGKASAPDGWKLERQRYRSQTTTFTFIGADADALQTHSNKYWDYVDTIAPGIGGYTYRVRAINADETNMAGREWSRRATAYCN